VALAVAAAGGAAAGDSAASDSEDAAAATLAASADGGVLVAPPPRQRSSSSLPDDMQDDLYRVSVECETVLDSTSAAAAAAATTSAAAPSSLSTSTSAAAQASFDAIVDSTQLAALSGHGAVQRGARQHSVPPALGDAGGVRAAGADAVASCSSGRAWRCATFLCRTPTC
jgi:hypothetical protein